MRITDVDIARVVVPMRPDTTNGAQFGERPFQLEPIHILQVHTDEGLVGLGETARNLLPETVEAACAPLVGLDPLAVNLQDLASTRVVGETPLAPLGGSRAYSGIEMALCDLVGKALGVPAYKLLGGTYRDRVAVSYWTGTRTPDDLARIAGLAWEQGFRALKYKCRYGEPHPEQVRAVASQVPGLELVVDFNTDLRRPIEAVRMAERIADCDNILVWEDPIPHWDWNWYAHLRQRVNVPIAAHLGQPTDVIGAIKADAVDYLNLGGGMFEFVRLADIADAAGIPCWHGAGLELGIAGASHLHACAAAQGCTLPSDTLGSVLREDDLVVEGIAVRDGLASVPQGPGLGVELDEEALRRYTSRA